MALANHNVKIFKTPSEMQDFIQNDAGIASVVFAYADNNGMHILIYTTS